MEGVIAALTARGLRVGVIKHHGHDVELDVPKKDSWRHAKAGAVATIVSNPSQFALVQRVERERSLAELMGLLPDVDAVLTEGFRASAIPAIEVLRDANSAEPLCELQQLAALVTDVPVDRLPAPIAEAIAAGTLPLFGLDDAKAIAERHRGRRVTGPGPAEVGR